MLNMNLAIYKNRLIIRLEGELDQASCDKIKRKVIDVIRRFKIVNIVFNLELLSFMDSTGIGFIISRYTEVRRKGGSVILCCMNEHVERIVKISGLNRIVTSCKSEVEVDKMLGVRV